MKVKERRFVGGGGRRGLIVVVVVVVVGEFEGMGEWGSGDEGR